MHTLTIDELIRGDHYYLAEDDLCYYFLEYTARQKASYSRGNQLITNFKKKMSRRDKIDWRYKVQAIGEVATILKTSMLPFQNSNTILVPIPPSKIKGHVLYDDRLVQVLRNYCSRFKEADMREIISYRLNLEPSHETNDRPNPDVIYENLEIDEDLCQTDRETIFLFDDVITTGAHFKACKQKLQESFPEADIRGLFIARREIDHSNDFELDFDF